MPPDFLKNFVLNLKATGPAAVLVVLIVGITLVGIFGQGTSASSALNILAFIAGGVAISLASRS